MNDIQMGIADELEKVRKDRKGYIERRDRHTCRQTC